MRILLSENRDQSFLYITLAIFIIAVYITGLFPETTIDSAKYAAISRHIFESGDLIHLKIHGYPYMDKPPLLFWLGAFSFRLFGISIFAFKLPALLFSFLGIWSVYRLGCLIYSKRTGIIAALFYSTSEAFFLYSMDVHTDLLFTSNVIFGTWQIMEYLIKRRVWNYILGFAGIGLAMISKGALGLAIPVFAIGGYLIIKKDWRNLFSFKWLAGIPVLIVILYPALKGVYDQFGIQGIKFYFWSNNIDRIAGVYSHYRHDYLFYLHTLLYVFMPWSLYACSKAVVDWREWKKSGFSLKDSKNSFCYSGILVLAIIISVSSQQAPHYLLPTIPFVAILSAQFINDISDGELYPKTYKLMLVFRTIVAVVLWFLAVVTAVYFFPVKSLLIWIPVAIIFFIFIFSYFNLKTGLHKLIIPPLTAICVLCFIANTVYMPSALLYHGPIQASYIYNGLASEDEALYTYDYIQFETYFYPERVSELADRGQLEDIFSKGTCWFITTEAGLNEIESCEGAAILEKYAFPYKKLTNISIKFLNPKTRAKTLSKIYLLKIA